jgi:hypothetical protein
MVGSTITRARLYQTPAGEDRLGEINHIIEERDLFAGLLSLLGRTTVIYSD